MSLEQRFEPRNVLPYTDQEIRDLYLRAQEESEAKSKTGSSAVSDYASHSGYVVFEILALTLGSYILVYLATVSALGMPVALWLAALTFVVVAFTLASVVRRRAIGPFSILAYRLAQSKLESEEAEINPYNPAVLQAVVNYVASEPLEQAESIQASVNEDVQQIENALTELPLLASALREEMDRASDTTMKLLIEGKHSAAVATIDKLRTLAGELRKQAQEAQEAVRPIRELCDRFEHIHRLSTSLSRIQAAYGLIEESEQSLEDHRLQLQLLRAVSATAVARLREIENIVQSHETAQLEIRSLV